VSIPLDQPIKLTLATFSDPAQTAPADPTTVTIDVLDPSGVTTTFTWSGAQVVRDSIGVFHLNYSPVMPGHYAYHWKATGTVATGQDGEFDVARKFSASISLSDVKLRLAIPAADDSQDVNLQQYLNSAMVILQNLYGDVIPTTYTETLRAFGDGTQLLTWRSPLLSVDSITVTWPYPSTPTIALSPNLYFTNLATGEISIYAFSPAFSWQYAYRDWSHAWFLVTYTAGRAAVTANVKDAVLELLRINYAPQRAGGYYPGQGASDDPDEGFTYQGYYIPNGVHERLSGGERPRQIA
jgi:hypothetical protein